MKTIDETNKNIGYLLGRLFAVYDKLKEDESDRKTNRRDAFFSAFSTRPLTVFLRLEQLAQFDLKKLSRSKDTIGIAINTKKRIAHIVSIIGQPETNVPKQLSNEQQAWFVMGYYHQREDFFTSSNKKEEIAIEQSAI